MSINRGIVTEITSDSARPISVTSTLPIALVLTSNVIESKVYYFDSIEKAYDSFTEKIIATKKDEGNLLKYLKAGVDLFGLIVPTIVIVSKYEKTKTEDKIKSNFINAIGKIKTAPSIFGFKPDIIIAGYDKFDIDVVNAIDVVCGKLKARSFVNLFATSNTDAITKREKISSDRLTALKCSLKIFNTDTEKEEYYDSSVIVGLLRAFVDGSSNIGYSQSISNRVLKVSGISSPSEFYPGALDETDPLTEKQIMSFIAYKGIRTWEYATCSVDQIWQDARRVRILDLAASAVLDGIFFAVDKDVSALNSAKDSLRGFLNRLVGNEVLAGFSVELDLKKTTKEAITAGEFYFVVKLQEMPSPRLIKVTFNRVNEFSEVIYKAIEG